jgi:hypothetical protein
MLVHNIATICHLYSVQIDLNIYTNFLIVFCACQVGKPIVVSIFECTLAWAYIVLDSIIVIVVVSMSSCYIHWHRIVVMVSWHHFVEVDVIVHCRRDVWLSSSLPEVCHMHMCSAPEHHHIHLSTCHPPHTPETLLKGRACHSTHFYGSLMLVTDAVGPIRGKYISPILAARFRE